MITGGVASVVYGDPRFTPDVDLVLELPANAVGRFANAFAGEAFYVPPRGPGPRGRARGRRPVTTFAVMYIC